MLGHGKLWVRNAEEIACYERFLVNRCIDESRARRVADVRKAQDCAAQGRRNCATIEVPDRGR